MNDKQRRIFKWIIIGLSVFLVGEIIFFAVKYYLDRQDSVFYTIVNNAVIDDDSYIAAGYSDYRHSDFNEYDRGYYKATLFVGEDDEVTKEISLDLGYNGYYNDVIKTDDGYVAVGKIQMDKEQKEEGLSEGLIVKYDKNFKVEWRENISLLGRTELNRIKEDKDSNYIIVGESVYGNGYVGNHTTGGGILLKYTPEGKEKLRVNNGGPYSGKFNDVLLEKDGYVVVGLGKSYSGVIIKYDLKGKKVWSGSYGSTDKNGINSIAKLGNNYITATTKVVDTEDLSKYSAALVLFNNKGEKIDDVKYSSNDITYFADVKVDEDKNVVACGYTGKLKDNDHVTDAVIVKYDEDLYEEYSNILKGENNEYYNNVYFDGDDIIALGYSNSKLKEFDLNGYDYFPIGKVYNSKLK